MITLCPHCQTGIEIDPTTLAALQGQQSFQCPACEGLVAVPVSRAPVKVTVPAKRQLASAAKPSSPRFASAHRSLNRNFLILGTVTLLVLGGIGFYLASQKSGDTNTVNQNIRNEILNNSYFAQLIADGVTTKADLGEISDIRPYKDGFIGISKEPLTWEQTQVLAEQTGARLLSVDNLSAESKGELVKWLGEVFDSHLTSPVWISQQGSPSVLASAEILALKITEGERKALLSWRPNETNEKSKPNEKGDPALATTEQPSVKTFGKQEDPDHQRKLAVLVIEKGGTVDVWDSTGIYRDTSGNAFLNDIRDVKALPLGKLELKEVRFISSPFPNEAADLLNGCNKLMELSLYCKSVEALPLESLDALKKVDLGGYAHTMSLVTPLRGNTNITDLRLFDYSAPLSNEIITIVASMPNLASLNLGGLRIEGDALSLLAELKLLKSINLAIRNCTDNELLVLSKMPMLEKLTLESMDLTNFTFASLAECKNLSDLYLSNCDFGRRTLEGLAQVSTLETIDMHDPKHLTAEMLLPLGGHRSLKNLVIGRTRISGESLGKVKPIPNLDRLELDGGEYDFGDALAATLLSFAPNLTKLNLTGVKFSASGYQNLASLEYLSSLVLHDVSHLDEASMQVLANMKGLRELLLDYAELTSSLLTALEPAQSHLGSLLITSGRVDDQVIPMLEKFRHLEMLNIRGTVISKEGTERLRKALPGCRLW